MLSNNRLLFSSRYIDMFFFFRQCLAYHNFNLFLMFIVYAFLLSMYASLRFIRLLITVHPLCLVEDMQSAAANVEQSLCRSHWALDGRKPPPTQCRQYRADMEWLMLSTICWRFLATVFLWRSAELTSSHPTSFVCLECCSVQTCRWTSTSPHSAQSAFSSCRNYDARSQWRLCRHTRSRVRR